MTLTYGYDQQGDETSVKDSLSSQGITTYSYDLAQRMTTITTSYGGTAGPQVVYGYDPANRLTSESRTVGGTGNSVNTTISYDAANREVTITQWAHLVSSGGSNTALATYVYTYDNANRVTSEKDAEGTASFTYDNANELTAVSGSRTESYSYDLNGNRNSTGYATGTDNELTASSGATYTYDNAGNLVSTTNTSTHVTASYTYDYRNRLTQVTVGGTIVATYTYDALDRRIGIKESGTQTWTAYDGTSADAHPYADFTGASGGSLSERYLFGHGVVNGAVVDQILARTSAGGTTAWYLTDELGSVRDIASSSGIVLDHIVYDSFGNVLSETNAANGDRFKFAGMEYDATTGQYYDRARDYSAVAGRFTAQDPLAFAAADTNLYRYVGNAPTDIIDPSGKEWVVVWAYWPTWIQPTFGPPRLVYILRPTQVWSQPAGPSGGPAGPSGGEGGGSGGFVGIGQQPGSGNFIGPGAPEQDSGQPPPGGNLDPTLPRGSSDDFSNPPVWVGASYPFWWQQGPGQRRGGPFRRFFGPR